MVEAPILSVCNVSPVDGPLWKWEAAGSNPATQTRVLLIVCCAFHGKGREEAQSSREFSVPQNPSKVHGLDC